MPVSPESSEAFFQAAASIFAVLLLTGVVSEVRALRERSNSQSRLDRASVWLFLAAAALLFVGELVALDALLSPPASGWHRVVTSFALAVGLLLVMALSFISVIATLTNIGTIRRRARQVAVAGLAVGAIVAGGLLVRGVLTDDAGLGSPRVPRAVVLDSDLAVRLVTGPGAPSRFGNALRVRRGNVVQVSVIVQNTEPVDAPSAEGLRVRVIFRSPVDQAHGAVGALEVASLVTADNAAERQPFKLEDQARLTGAQGGQVTVGEVRAVVIQHNLPLRGKPYNFAGSTERVASERVNVRRTPTTTEVEIQPTEKGTLSPKPEDPIRLVFLLDVLAP